MARQGRVKNFPFKPCVFSRTIIFISPLLNWSSSKAFHKSWKTKTQEKRRKQAN